MSTIPTRVSSDITPVSYVASALPHCWQSTGFRFSFRFRFIYLIKESKYRQTDRQTDRQTNISLTEIKVISDLFVIVIREFVKIYVNIHGNN